MTALVLWLATALVGRARARMSTVSMAPSLASLAETGHALGELAATVSTSAGRGATHPAGLDPAEIDGIMGGNVQHHPQ